MIIFGLDTSTVNWYLVAYVIISIGGLVFGTTKIYSTDQVRGIIFGIGALIVLVYFGFRWFGTTVKPLKTWPPVINACPDFLTYIPSPTSSGKAFCIDLLGVSKNSTLPISSASDLNSPSGITPNKKFIYTSADVTDPKQGTSMEAICKSCSDLGLTWEGVYDGDTCVGQYKSDAIAAAAATCLLSV